MLATGSDGGTRGARRLVVAGWASIGAGAIHATAAGNHGEHRQAVIAFVAVAAFQLAWGVLALVRATTVLAWLGIIGHAAAVGGWALAKTSGIGFVDGLEGSEDVQFADALAAGLAIVVVVASLVSLTGWAAGVGSRMRHVASQRELATVAALVGVALVVPGMVAAGSHSHAGGDAHGAGAQHLHGDDGEDQAVEADAAAHADHAASEPQPFDPELPIDLGGTPGVTPQQQAEAENLLAVTLLRLPQFADYQVAEARGYHSIGDGITGHEHFVNRDLINDEHILDPDHPESLVYEVNGDEKTLVAAMFMLPHGTTLDDVPDFGGNLVQWHVHDNLCFTPDPVAPRVASVTPAERPCPGSTVRGPQVPMVHVWITPHRCGPFAALDGVGAGQIAADETRLCDHDHGSSA